MKKILLSILLIAALLFSGCEAKPRESVKPPFWAICDEESGGMVYMLGSMHVGSNAEYPEEVMNAFEESDIIACEVDTVELSRDSGRLSEAMEFMKCPDGINAAGIAMRIYRTFSGKRGYIIPYMTIIFRLYGARF